MSHKNETSSQASSNVKPLSINLQTRPFAPLEAPQSESSSDEQAKEFSRKQMFSESILERLINTPTPESATPVQRKPENRLKSAARERIIQAKLNIGEPNDKYEKEADATAAKVVQQINTPLQSQSVQRQESMEEDGELQMKSLIQRRENVGGGVASTDLESSIQSARGSGQSLDGSLSEKLGQAMGADFSGVKVHTDSQSDHLNKSIQAKAFTTGQDVFFRQGAYDPSSRGGQELIAHELTHVVQQNGGAVQAKMSLQREPALEKDELQLKSISANVGIGSRPLITDLQMKPLLYGGQKSIAHEVTSGLQYMYSTSGTLQRVGEGDEEKVETRSRSGGEAALAAPQATANFFDQASTDIFNLMQRDSFERFKASMRQNGNEQEKIAVSIPAFNLKMCLGSRTTWRLKYRTHLGKEFSLENLDFIEAVEDYKKSPDIIKRRNVYTQFIADSSPQFINLSSSTRNPILKEMK